jgi:hypothetical protein
MDFSREEPFPGCVEWFCYLDPTPYKIVQYEWFDCFMKRRGMRHLKQGKPFYCAYYGWWIRKGKAQFGNHVDRNTTYYQTLKEAQEACNAAHSNE